MNANVDNAISTIEIGCVAVMGSKYISQFYIEDVPTSHRNSDGMYAVEDWALLHTEISCKIIEVDKDGNEDEIGYGVVKFSAYDDTVSAQICEGSVFNELLCNLCAELGIDVSDVDNSRDIING